MTAVSCFRILASPVFIFLFASPSPNERIASLPLLAVIFLTDLVDGVLARRWSVTTDFGYVLDGVADRSAHIAVVVALMARDVLSGMLGFLLVFRDIVLYAARALFETWWEANAAFRRRVRVAAVVFKLTVGSIAVLSYANDVAPYALTETTRSLLLTTLTSATWLFVAWSYVLLGQQVHAYSVHSPRVGD